MSLGRKLNTIRKLGLRNVARVAVYRGLLKLGRHPVQHLYAEPPTGPFFDTRPAPSRPLAQSHDRWRTTSFYFSRHEWPLDGPPDWHANPFRPGVTALTDQPWYKLPDFNADLGDIKTVWEASRFDWVIAMALRAAKGEDAERSRLNAWLSDWSAQNPPYNGVNWKCGQEASIRVMHLALAALVLGQTQATPPALCALIRLHLMRIAPTLSYALGQANNHGTSEAAALFIGGSWLAQNGDPDGSKWAATGRRWLEERAQTLILEDGTFSQYSATYHRVMLDTYSLAQSWRQTLNLPIFTKDLTDQIEAAIHWLNLMMDPFTGDVPNLGANDGARLIPLSDTAYRDFRPCLQLAAVAFLKQRAISDVGLWDQPAAWMDLPLAERALPAAHSTTLDAGGFHVLRRADVTAILHYPRFVFRPSQADLLHLDVWHKGVNLVRDAGSFSYAEDEPTGADLTAAQAHSTIELDGRDPMPRLGRFLYGSWPKACNVVPVTTTQTTTQAAAGYTDHLGASHHRDIRLFDGGLTCHDDLSGATKAVLRWRLAPAEWRLEGETLVGPDLTLKIQSDGPLDLRLVQGRESLYYLESDAVPVLEATLAVPTKVTSLFAFH